MKNQAELPYAPTALSRAIISLSSKDELNMFVDYYLERYQYFHRQKINRSKAEKLVAIDAGYSSFQDLEKIIENKRYLDHKGNANAVIAKATKDSTVFSHAYESSRLTFKKFFDVYADFLRLIVTIDGRDIELKCRLALFNVTPRRDGVIIAEDPIIVIGPGDHDILDTGTIGLNALSSNKLEALIQFNKFNVPIEIYTKLYDLFDSLSEPLSRDKNYRKVKPSYRDMLREYKNTGIKKELVHYQRLEALKQTVKVKHAAISQQYQQDKVISNVVYDKEISTVVELKAEAIATLRAFHKLAASVNLAPGLSY